MTDTAATKGSSADTAGPKPADDSALTEEARQSQASPDEASTAGEAAVDETPTAAGQAGAAESGEVEDGDGSAAPVEASELGDGSGTGPREQARPSFTRPPGMVPPPDHLDDGDRTWHGTTPVSGAPVSGAPVSGAPVSGAPSSGATGLSAYSWSGGGYSAAAAPVSAPPRVTGRQPAGTTGPSAGGETAPGGPADAAQMGEAIRPRPAATPRGPRRARLHLKRVDPWSVMKFSFAVSLVLFIVVIVAASVLYLALDAMGVFTSINDTVAELISSGAGDTADTFRITAQGVIGTAAVLGALNVLLFTSLATLGAFIYNVCADLVGGVEVTLAERD